jgi:hypothetical protein
MVILAVDDPERRAHERRRLVEVLEGVRLRQALAAIDDFPSRHFQQQLLHFACGQRGRAFWQLA